MQTKGWSRVMKFTYIQTIKSKPFIASCVVTLVVFVLMIMGSNFLPALLAEPENTVTVTDDEGNIIGEEIAMFKINKVYILDNSELNLDFEFLKELHIEHEYITQSQTSVILDKVTQSTEAEVMAVIEKGGEGNNIYYEITMSRPQSLEVIKSDDCWELINVFNSLLYHTKLTSTGITEEELALINAPVLFKVMVDGEEVKGIIAEMVGSFIIMITSIALFILIFTYAQMTAQAIATEKSSRVMELLLTSVKPLAVIIGKVLAMALVALTSIIAVGGLTVIVFIVTSPMGALGEVFGIIETEDAAIQELSAELSNSFNGIGALEIIAVIVIFILGFLFYSLIAGLIGATISRIEDLQTALQPLMLVSVFGFYLSYITPLFSLGEGGGGFIAKLSYYLPISSPYALPGAILSGDMSGGEAFLAIGFLALCLVLFAIFVAKVYEHIILHNGDRIKLKDMIKMVKKS
ncbi:MAG: ABC transporter permease [Oscillospiraceae bacterium]|nr:ABC transporter permease [Oscillospiraceae bacterium]